MKDRVYTAFGAVVACLIVVALFFQATPQAPITRPVSSERGRHGYLALRNWLERQNVAVVSMQERFDESLTGAPQFATGNIMITTMPHLHPLRLVEFQRLSAWIRAGNTLLIMAALDDTPEWSLESGGLPFIGQLRSLTGLGFEPVAADPADADERSPGPQVAAGGEIVFEPIAGHPLMAGVNALEVSSDAESALWRADTMPAFDGVLLRLAVERSSRIDAVWQMSKDSGQIVLVSSGSLLTNERLARPDTGRFVANLVRYHLGENGSVIFDDMHQGLTALYDPAAFYADRRLHYTVLFVIAGWLAYVLGASNRLAPVRIERPEPRQGDLLEAVGGFMARRLGRREAGLLLLDEWFDELRRARGLDDGAAPPWRHLAATPALSRGTLAELERTHERLRNGHVVNLVRLHNTLRQARKAIG